MDVDAKTAVLGSSALFSGLAEPALRDLASHVVLRRYPKGQVLFSEGDDADSLLVVVSGNLKVVSSSDSGHELLLAVLGRSDSLGELSIADGGPRSTTVIALSDCVVLNLFADTVMSAAMANPGLMRGMLASLAGVVRRLTGTTADLVFLDLPRRVAKYLLAQAVASSSSTLTLSLTQEELAQQLGASRQSLNATLRDFHRRDWIHAEGARITVRDHDALRRFIGV